MAERGQITRSAVENLPRRRRQAQPSTTVDTYFQAPQPSQQPDRMSRIVNGLFDFTGKAVDVAVRNEKTKIELDKVTQQQRAIAGLDPTDDATKAGLRAYQVVKMRDDVLEVNSDLARRIRDNPEMTDEEYEIATREAYAPLLSQYQADPQLAQALSNKLQESQVQVHQIRASVQREHRDWQRQEAFKTSIEEYREASASPDELAAMINEGGQLANEADALGITEEQRRTMLLNFAQMDAANGDGRILQAIEGQEWASRDPRVSKAREVYSAWEARHNAAEIGSAWGAIQMSWKNRSASWEQTVAAIDRLNQRFPGTVTANQVASLRQAGIAQHQADSERNAAIQGFWTAVQNGDAPHLGTNPLIPDEHKDAILGNFVETVETIARQKVAAGELTQEQAGKWVMEQKIGFSREYGLEVPGIKPIIESMTNVDPADWEGEGVPSHFLPALESIPMMNESDIEMYGNTERERNMMRNYQQFLSQDMADRDAWVRAYRSVANQSSLSPEDRAAMVEDVNSGIDDKLDRSVFQRGLGNLGLGPAIEKVPEGLRPYIRERARTEAFSMMGAGGVNFETVSDVAVERAMNRVTLLNQGTFVTRNTQQLLADGSFRDAEGKEYRLTQNNVSDAFQHFFDSRKDDMALESFYGQDLSIENVIFHANENGLIEVRDDTGEPLLPGTINVRDITRDYVDATAEQRAQRATERAQREFERQQLPPAERYGPGAVRR